jgi:hypothetical protein
MGKFWYYIIPTSYAGKLPEGGYLKQVSLQLSLGESFILTIGDYWVQVVYFGCWVLMLQA